MFTRTYVTHWLVIATIFLGTAGVPVVSEAQGPMCHVRVMTFNIRYNNPGDGENAWPHRKDMVADIIRQHADIAGLQEAQLDQIRDLEKR